MCKFPNSITKHALLDSGASCCTISSRLLQELQKHEYIPVEEAEINIEGCIPGVSKTGRRVAYIDITLETNHTLYGIPFIVYDGHYDLLIGSNVIKGCRWGNVWKN